jgi:hypothetical protein
VEGVTLRRWDTVTYRCKGCAQEMREETKDEKGTLKREEICPQSCVILLSTITTHLDHVGFSTIYSEH